LSELDDAAVAIEKAIELQPWNPQCYLGLAGLCEYSGRKEDREAYILKACEIDESGWSYYELSRFHLESNEYANALDACNSAFGKRYHLRLENMLLRVQKECLEKLGRFEDYKLCIEQYERSLRDFVSHDHPETGSWCYEFLLDFLWEQNRKAEAIELYETTIESKPQYLFELGIKLASCYKSIGDSKSEGLLYTTLYERVMKSDLNPTESDFDSKLEIMEKASEWLHLNGRNDFAVSLLNNACISYPGIPKLWDTFGNFLLHQTKDYDGAVKAFQHAIRLETDSTKAFLIRLFLADALFCAGRLDEAEIELKALNDRLKNMYILPLSDAMDGNLGHPQAIHPGHVVWVYKRLADIYSTHGRPREALEVLQEGIEQIPSYPTLFRELATTYIDLGNTPQAIESYRKYLTVFSNNWQESRNIVFEHIILGESVCKLVDLFIQENRIHEARDFLNQEFNLKRVIQALDDNPNAVVAFPRYEASLHWAEANLLVAEGRTAESIVEYEQCVEIQPELHTVWTRLAEAHAVCRDFTKAVECQAEAIEALRFEKYTGVGVLISQFESGTTITSVLPGSPAEQAGIKVGDIIVLIDGLQVPFSRSGLAGKPPGTQVTLTIKRGPNESLQDITLTHEQTISPYLIEYQDLLAAYRAGKPWREKEL
jgi:tetratricopeptide (TPR) repeat protein